MEETLELFSESKNFTVNPTSKRVLLGFEFTIGKKTIQKEYDIELKQKN